MGMEWRVAMRPHDEAARPARHVNPLPTSMFCEHARYLLTTFKDTARLMHRANGKSCAGC